MVSPTFAIELLKNALDIYTPSRSESQLANFLKDICMDLGFEQANIDSVGNMIAVRGSGDPTILLCGHMDTVPGIVPVRLEGDYLYGRGASDAKAPLISMLLAAADIPKQTCTIVFAGVVDEEGNATGIKNLVKDTALKPHYAIFGEPSGIENITISYKGRLEIRLMCDVENSAHASAPWLALNAVEELFNVWNYLKESFTSKEIGASDINNRADEVSFSLTEITGGTSHNVTPQKCRMTVDIRIPTKLSCDSVLKVFDRHVIQIQEKSPSLKIKYRVEDKTEPFQANISSPLVRALVLSILESKKKRPLLLRKTGTGDMNILGNVLNIPVVTYGPGDPHSSHTIDEKVYIPDYLTGIEVYKNALLHMVRLHKNLYPKKT
ncbi:M20/M25/M40 family metallo-hydrolase [Candidatus Nitrosocosmicus agrestis]|jgi:LysW-gamma-L-lysine carboxypeptidase|uniref:M20/M25/M40 family metallo-hydrolase n=1 Tax=Candidatus Nitrosocosmicus agrestis TaxID=2563600 RepID=UPI00122E0F40|nr:M20/M25/M40 family metallo-hydrolase [Candidatus Nitrosocosmicus sp. SS]KAA2282750.1 M20/M25/M40 family metallo-hydrolase [Candidatus Nitrosocosmicus sp. SS]KAF0870317.1 M20/M25/M40 family metallo-hydrolase [Candidatus Nitrosocosmicus sp. SS]